MACSRVAFLALLVSAVSADKVLFIGASNAETGGDIANKIIKLDASIEPVVLARSVEKAKALYSSFGNTNVEYLQGTMFSEEDVAKAAKGADSIWFITALPSYSNSTTELLTAQAVVAGAKKAGVQRLVFGVSSPSELFAEGTWMAGKAQVEECLRDSGLSWASIWVGWNLDSSFSQGFPAVRSLGVHPFVYPSEMKLTLTYHIDIARASVKLLKDKSLQGTFSVYDPQPHTMQSLADAMAKVVGHKVRPMPFHFFGYLFTALQPVAPYLDGKLQSLCELIIELWHKDFGPVGGGLSVDEESNKRGQALFDGPRMTLDEWMQESALLVKAKPEL